MLPTEQKFCSQLSQSAGEQLIGSAGRTDVYFLLEYTGVWEDKAFGRSPVPEAVKLRLNGLVKALPAAKVLLIKRGQRTALIHFFVVLANPLAQRCYAFTLGDYAEILDLDLSALLEGDPQFEPYRSDTPFYLVCTNGRRDLCCARFGFPVYEALTKGIGERAWEVSHVGGHRFAANLLHLPYGMLYGRVKPQDVPELLPVLQDGQIALDFLRGRTAYPGAAQAAEGYLRRQTGELGLDAYRLETAVEVQPGHWQVEFKDSHTGIVFPLKVIVEKGPADVYDSCMLDKQTSVIGYRLG